MPWESIQYRLRYSTAVISSFLNAFLIFLILTKSPKRLGAYKYLMILISVFELFYSLIDVILTPIFYSCGSSNVVYVNLEKSVFSREIALILIADFLTIFAKSLIVSVNWLIILASCLDILITLLNILSANLPNSTTLLFRAFFVNYFMLFHVSAVYCGCFGFSLAVLGIHFVYRYLVVSGKKHFQYLQGSKIGYWMIIPVVYGVIWGLTAYFFCDPTEYSDEYLKNGLLESYDIQISQITYLGLLFYPKDKNGVPYLSEKTMTAFSIFLVEISTSLLVIFYFGINCYIKINKLIKMTTVSSKYAGLQTQLFYALVTQAMIPVALMHVPAMLMFLLVLSGRELGLTCGIVSITIALYPALDPLPTIFIIKSYRKAVFGYIRYFRLLPPERDSSTVEIRSSSGYI